MNGFPIDIDFTIQPLESIIGQWKFDRAQSTYDESGTHNDMVSSPLLGPGMGGNGNSAYFNGENYTVLPHNDAYNRVPLTISFWIFPLASTD